MAEITARREPTQPIREKTGGSTFKNPPGHSSWKLVDEAGWRGKPYGGAMFSPLHSNFLINTGEATAADLEGLGEAVRADVKAKIGSSWSGRSSGSAAPAEPGRTACRWAGARGGCGRRDRRSAGRRPLADRGCQLARRRSWRHCAGLAGRAGAWRERNDGAIHR